MGESFGGRQEAFSSTRINKDLREQGQYAIEQARGLYDDPTQLPSTYVGVSPERQQALDEMMATAGRGEVAGAALPEWQKTVGGEYLDPDANPWMQEIVDRSVSAAASAPVSGYATSGRFGSGAMAKAVADAGSATAARMWGGNYQAERQRMMTALGMTGAMQGTQYADPLMKGRVGMEYEQDEANRIAEMMRQFQWPYAKLEQFQSSLTGNPLMGESSTTTVSKQPFQWGSALLGGVGGLLSP